jgi:hypothetical protein
MNIPIIDEKEFNSLKTQLKYNPNMDIKSYVTAWDEHGGEIKMIFIGFVGGFISVMIAQPFEGSLVFALFMLIGLILFGGFGIMGLMNYLSSMSDFRKKQKLKIEYIQKVRMIIVKSDSYHDFLRNTGYFH